VTLRLESLKYTYDTNDRFQSSNITLLKIEEKWLFNATFIYKQKIPKAKINFKFYIPKYQNASVSDLKLFDTSVDLCEAGKIIKSNFLVRTFLQTFVDCALDSFSCPFEHQLRLRNCPGEN
jgi:Protein of unknown function (DUF1091)